MTLLTLSSFVTLSLGNEHEFSPSLRVRIKIQAWGIRHSGSMIKEGSSAGLKYPRVPGHEVPGIIDEVGKDVFGWKPGQRVAFRESF